MTYPDGRDRPRTAFVRSLAGSSSGSLFVRSHSERLLGRLRMADVNTHEPQRSRCLINAIPESAAADDFVLPLLQLHTDDPAGPERALEGVLPAVTMARVRGDALPRGSRIAWCCGADLLPSPDRFVGGEAEVPTARCWRWWDSLLPLRHDPQPAGIAIGSPAAAIGLRSRRTRAGSAKISAVAFHSRSSCATVA